MQLHGAFPVSLIAAALSCTAIASSQHRGHPREMVIANAQTRHPASEISVGLSVSKNWKEAQALTLVSWSPQSFLVPVQTAAAVLERIYKQTANQSRGPWSRHDPPSSLTATTGNIRLAMSAGYGHTVLWKCLNCIALQMLEYSRRGYTGTFTARYIRPGTESGILVSLSNGALKPSSARVAPTGAVLCISPGCQAWSTGVGRRTKALQAREKVVPRDYSDLRLVAFDEGVSISPSLAAALVLERFYTDIARGAHGPWAARYEARRWLRVTFGAIQLVMTATEPITAAEVNTIPWSFVAWFAETMLHWTRRGFLNTCKFRVNLLIYYYSVTSLC